MRWLLTWDEMAWDVLRWTENSKINKKQNSPQLVSPKMFPFSLATNFQTYRTYFPLSKTSKLRCCEVEGQKTNENWIVKFLRSWNRNKAQRNKTIHKSCYIQFLMKFEQKAQKCVRHKKIHNSEIREFLEMEIAKNEYFMSKEYIT